VTDPVASRTLLDVIWKLALVLGVALTAEWLMLRGVRRPLPALEKLVPLRDCNVRASSKRQRRPAAAGDRRDRARQCAVPHRHVRGAHDGVAKSTQPARHERRDSGLYRDLGQAHRYVGVFGIAIANVALLLGLYRSG